MYIGERERERMRADKDIATGSVVFK